MRVRVGWLIFISWFIGPHLLRGRSNFRTPVADHFAFKLWKKTGVLGNQESQTSSGTIEKLFHKHHRFPGSTSLARWRIYSNRGTRMRNMRHFKSSLDGAGIEGTRYMIYGPFLDGWHFYVYHISLRQKPARNWRAWPVCGSCYQDISAQLISSLGSLVVCTCVQ